MGKPFRSVCVRYTDVGLQREWHEQAEFFSDRQKQRSIRIFTASLNANFDGEAALPKKHLSGWGLRES